MNIALVKQLSRHWNIHTCSRDHCGRRTTEKITGIFLTIWNWRLIDWCEWNLRTQFGCVMNFPLCVFVCLPDVCTDVLVKQHHCRECEKPTPYKSRSRATVHSLTCETRPTIGALSSTTDPTDEWKSLTTQWLLNWSRRYCSERILIICEG